MLFRAFKIQALNVFANLDLAIVNRNIPPRLHVPFIEIALRIGPSQCCGLRVCERKSAGQGLYVVLRAAARPMLLALQLERPCHDVHHYGADLVYLVYLDFLDIFLYPPLRNGAQPPTLKPYLFAPAFKTRQTPRTRRSQLLSTRVTTKGKKQPPP
mmetsp:Transcript_46758/g.124212  ORF Transcript_46758/g.124212 Transcript_46758/m.124212 type:complete len:156 (-) Transcript_46758:57-524(-)